MCCICSIFCKIFIHCDVMMFILKWTSMFEISKESKCVPHGGITSQVDERKYCFLHTVCTCNSHRLSEEWREPGHSALSALMMRQLEAIFQLGLSLTLKHLWSTLPSLPMTRMDGTSAKLTIYSNLIWWLYWANATISLTLGYLPWRAEVDSSLLVKNGLHGRAVNPLCLMKTKC